MLPLACPPACLPSVFRQRLNTRRARPAPARCRHRDDVNIFVVLKAMGCESDQEAVQAVVGGGFGAKLVPAAGGAGGAGGPGKGAVIAPDAASGEGAAALAALLVPSVQEAKGLGVFTQMQALDYLGERRLGWGL
jgi:DNA-directed RNA polymerase III subunit RPC2